ncbi:MAG: hypothetical protein A3F43_05290 [Gammaproteobacteria bacterium RIFCSPHIGHO2_12_FULL_42_10]|nr:MAG: hypothetical protein A3F43_05290 [Gammaproteobacteria bacterium RIFCSPHIGHO2_12_FULL_42_10]
MKTHTHTKTHAKHHHHLTTGKILTDGIRKSIKALTKSHIPARVTLQRMDKILCTLHARAKKWAKANCKTRH